MVVKHKKRAKHKGKGSQFHFDKEVNMHGFMECELITSIGFEKDCHAFI